MYHVPVVSDLVDDSVNCIFVSADGDIEVECNCGGCSPSNSPTDLVLFQRGLKCSAGVKRSCTGVFSPFLEQARRRRPLDERGLGTAPLHGPGIGGLPRHFQKCPHTKHRQNVTSQRQNS